MDNEKDIERNRPSREGHDNDPNIRDESAYQPGIQTNSPSGTDNANQSVTRSAMDGPERIQFDTDDNADPTFDTISSDKT